MRIWQLIATVLRLARTHRRGIALMVILGVCSSLTESIGIALFLPLLQSLTGQSSNAYAAIPLMRLLRVTGQFGLHATFAIPILIGLAVLVRSLLTYGSNVTNSRVKTQVGHDLRCRVMERVLAMEAAAFEREGVSGLWNTMATETWRCSEAVGIVGGLFTSRMLKNPASPTVVLGSGGVRPLAVVAAPCHGLVLASPM